MLLQALYQHRVFAFKHYTRQKEGKKKSLSATDYIFKNGKAVGSQQLLTEQLLTLWNTEVLHYFRWLVYKFKQHAALFRIMRESQTQQGMRKQVR